MFACGTYINLEASKFQVEATRQAAFECLRIINGVGPDSLKTSQLEAVLRGTVGAPTIGTEGGRGGRGGLMEGSAAAQGDSIATNALPDQQSWQFVVGMCFCAGAGEWRGMWDMEKQRFEGTPAWSEVRRRLRTTLDFTSVTTSRRAYADRTTPARRSEV